MTTPPASRRRPLPPEIQETQKAVAALEGLGLRPRTAWTLVRGGYRAPADLRKATDQELLDVAYFGPRMLHEVRQFVPARFGDARIICPACAGRGWIKQKRELVVGEVQDFPSADRRRP